jgi:hypothetical protein
MSYRLGADDEVVTELDEASLRTDLQGSHARLPARSVAWGTSPRWTTVGTRGWWPFS